MKEIKDIIGFLIFGLVVAVALWFGAMLMLFIFGASVLLAIFITLRTYYLRWRYKGAFMKPTQSNNNPEIKATIIDVEYHDISDKK